MLSFIDHTPERLAHHSERQAGRRGDPRPHQRSDNGLWNLPRKYARQYARADEVKKKGNIKPMIGWILLFLIFDMLIFLRFIVVQSQFLVDATKVTDADPKVLLESFAKMPELLIPNQGGNLRFVKSFSHQ